MVLSTMLLKSLILVVYVSSVTSELPADCQAVFNGDDCGDRPSMVYTYFSALSLCHPAIWRGCETRNKFANQYHCVKYCTRKTGDEVKPNRCDVPLSATRCKNHTKEVYTFSPEKKACIKVLWNGCPSENIFDNILRCRDACQKQWVDKLAGMEIYEIQEASDFLKELVDQYDIKPVEGRPIHKTPVKLGIAEIIDKIREANSQSIKPDICDVPINTSRCQNHTKEVYTFSPEKKACTKVPWNGCPSDNIFANITRCRETCQMVWVDKLAKMDISEIEKASGFLNEFTDKYYNTSFEGLIVKKPVKLGIDNALNEYSETNDLMSLDDFEK